MGVGCLKYYHSQDFNEMLGGDTRALRRLVQVGWVLMQTWGVLGIIARMSFVE